MLLNVANGYATFIGGNGATLFTYRYVQTEVNIGRCLDEVACADYYINVSD